jgi:phosphatidylglycerol:prolipoprotein diacylglycerol transferase
MRPILFRWRGLTDWSYPAMLYLGLVAGTVAGNIAAHEAGINAFRLFVATILLMIAALIGARLAHVLSHWQIYRRSLRRIWDRNDGGYAQDGGIVLVVFLSVPLIAALELPLGASLDAGVFTMLVIPIFARIGCVLNGCCVGRPTSSRFSTRLSDHRGVWERRIPCQFLEATWAAVLLVFAVTIWPWMPFPGALFLLLAAIYNAGRVVLLSLRDSPSDAYRPALQHAISISMIVLPLAAFVRLWEGFAWLTR